MLDNDQVPGATETVDYAPVIQGNGGGYKAFPLHPRGMFWSIEATARYA